MNTLLSTPQSPNATHATVQRSHRRATRLSARQLLDVELGLFLLAELLHPTRCPVC
ncbi:hypothetical protein GCM10027299_28320 [Larkinella ripae]